MKLKTKIATSGSKEGILKLLNQWCMSSSCNIDFETGDCFNAKGLMSTTKCILQRWRYVVGYVD